jgi:hypothetical protein
MTLEHDLLQLASDAMRSLMNGREFAVGQTGHYLNIIRRIEDELNRPKPKQEPVALNKNMTLGCPAYLHELAKPEQEPVAFLFDDMTWTCQKSWTNEIKGGTPVYAKPFKNCEEPVAWMDKEDIGDMRFTSVEPTYENDLVPLYTSPPRKEWVGLTAEEIHNCWQSAVDENGFTKRKVYDAIEAKLKEKNT